VNRSDGPADRLLGRCIVPSRIRNVHSGQCVVRPKTRIVDLKRRNVPWKSQNVAPDQRKENGAKHVDDVVFKAESDSLSMAQQFYALLQRRALTDGELATAMAPVVTYFARKPVPKSVGALTKPQKKATTKAVNTLKKNAPQMLQDGGGPAGAVTPGQGAPAPVAAGAAAPAAGGGTPAVTGNGAAAPAAPTGVGRS
jgi:hypothetical protein